MHPPPQHQIDEDEPNDRGQEIPEGPRVPVLANYQEPAGEEHGTLKRSCTLKVKPEDTYRQVRYAPHDIEPKNPYAGVLGTGLAQAAHHEILNIRLTDTEKARRNEKNGAARPSTASNSAPASPSGTPSGLVCISTTRNTMRSFMASSSGRARGYTGCQIPAAHFHLRSCLPLQKPLNDSPHSIKKPSQMSPCTVVPSLRAASRGHFQAL